MRSSSDGNNEIFYVSDNESHLQPEPCGAQFSSAMDSTRHQNTKFTLKGRLSFRCSEFIKFLDLRAMRRRFRDWML
ncbi:CNT_collapsed_G0015970.mRNA.1.CDS.1 [Saccharomyces cerevisiae]|nr:CNT_collapsed_G0015970.mRNA.1.CDS.1 [Saccharomyces cerevisiae]